MALPTRSQPDWDDELNNHINGLDANIQAAAAQAAVAASDAAYARNRADEVHTAVVGGADAAVAGFIDDDTSATKASLSATYAGRGVGRFIRRAQAGEALTITALGDSIVHGQTVTNPATDGMMILLAADLSARFGTTITQTNRAMGGRTLLTAHTFSDIANALTDAADLYLISYGKNDSQIYFGTQGGEYGPGYPRAQSIAALERTVRRIRDRVPKADIVLMGSNPYVADLNGTTNTALKAYNAEMERLAAQYGCEWVDNFAPFADLGTFTAYMDADGVHPNTAGHRLMADTVLEHFPAAYDGPASMPGRPATLATLMPGKVDASKGKGGYVTAADTSVTGLTFTKTGTGWAGTNPHTTSTAGDYIEYVFTGPELHLNISCRDADAPRFDVRVDGVTVKTNANPLLAGGRIDYFVPVALGLTAAQHTVRITLVSGTLKINQAAALVGPGSDITGDTVTLDIAAAASQTLLVDTAGGVTAIVDNITVPMPAGWSAMDVTFIGFLTFYVQGQTTSPRNIKVLPKVNGSYVQNLIATVGAVATSEFGWATIPINYTRSGVSASFVFDVDANLTSTDKTNVRATEWGIKATCQRTA